MYWNQKDKTKNGTTVKKNLNIRCIEIVVKKYGYPVVSRRTLTLDVLKSSKVKWLYRLNKPKNLNIRCIEMHT